MSTNHMTHFLSGEAPERRHMTCVIYPSGIYYNVDLLFHMPKIHMFFSSTPEFPHKVPFLSRILIRPALLVFTSFILFHPLFSFCP